MADNINDLQGYPLFSFDFNWAATPSTRLAMPRYLHGFQGTSHYLETLENKNRLVFDAEVMLDSESDIDTFLDFVEDKMGIVNPFWVRHPFCYFQFETYPGAADTSLIYNYVNADDFLDNNNRLYIDLANGDTLAWKISNVLDSVVVDRTFITIPKPIGRALTSADVPFSGLLLFCRFGNKEFKLEYKRTRLASVKLKFVELPQEVPA